MNIPSVNPLASLAASTTNTEVTLSSLTHIEDESDFTLIVIEIEKENNIKNRDKRKQNDSSEGSIDIDNDKIEKG
uniref:Uncharacterized protein n=1 Tax=Rhizophagus irregularis (strain DAOM 181602 / DAOM 197198 / MUCL 43194) TaxID=747089 RepID=U9SIK4_RHIID